MNKHITQTPACRAADENELIQLNPRIFTQQQKREARKQKRAQRTTSISRISECSSRRSIVLCRESVEVIGELKDNKGDPIVEEVEFWRRDPIECIRELIGSPAFQKYLSYVPEMHFMDRDTDGSGQNCRYDESWTGDWWWKLQVSELTLHLSNPYLWLRNGCLLAPQSCQSFSPQIKPISHVLAETSRRGQSTSRLTTSRKTSVENHQSAL